MIKNIIFDLGNVLVDVHYEKFREKIYRNNISKEAYDTFFLNGNYRLLGYEAGKISTDEFVNRCINGLKLKMNREEFIFAFNDMFSEITPMKNLVISLSNNNNYRLFLLSNTSPLHWNHALRNFNYLDVFDKLGLSYELKALKPDREIYERAISHFGVAPEDSLFIDDMPENCEAANRFGIKTIIYNKFNHSAFEKEFFGKYVF